MDLELSHFTDKPVSEIRSMEQTWRYGKPAFHEKPKGLWVSADGDDDWLSWCLSEKFALEKLQKRYRVVLTADAKILRVPEDMDFLAFKERYGRDLPDYGYPEIYIDWPAVAQEYQGIVIAPYQWQHRLGEMWYYGWDCASGCIWDRLAISHLETRTEWGFADSATPEHSND
jgi:hypothetical protein